MKEVGEVTQALEGRRSDYEEAGIEDDRLV
jgi:hypothetical protein